MHGIHDMSQQHAFSAHNPVKEYEAIGMADQYEVRGYAEEAIPPSTDGLDWLASMQQKISAYSFCDDEPRSRRYGLAHPGLTIIGGALAGFGSFPVVSGLLATGLTLVTLSIGLPVALEGYFEENGVRFDTGCTAVVKTGIAAVSYGISVLLLLSLQRH